MFLTKAELIELTGYKYPKKQICWLSHRGYKYEISAIGYPKVLKSYIENILGSINKQNKLKSSQPDWEALKIYNLNVSKKKNY